MKPTALLIQSLQSVWGNRLRSFLTTLGIIIGIAAVITLVGLGKGLEANVKQQFGALDTTLLTVRSQEPERAQAEQPAGVGRGQFLFKGGGVNALTSSDYELVKKIDHITQASPEGQSDQVGVATIADASKASQYSVNGVDSSYFGMQGARIVEGKNITDKQVANKDKVTIVGEDVAKELFPSESSFVGKDIYLNNTAYTIVGVVSKEKSNAPTKTSTVNPSLSIFIGYKQWLELVDKDKFATIVASVDSEEHVNAVVENIGMVLRSNHSITDESKSDFLVIANQQLLEASKNIAANFTTTLAGIAAISLLVGGIGIMNMMLVTVTERTREIGLRRAVGAKKWHILVQFLMESVLLTLIGGGLGLLTGILFGSHVGELLSFGGGQTVQSVIDIQIALIAIVISTFIGVIFGLFPAIKAGKMDPIDALRYE